MARKVAAETRSKPQAKPAVAPRRAASRPRTRKPATVARKKRPTDTRLTVEQLNRRYYDAFQSLDLEAMGRIWWHDDDAACIHPGWDVRHGWAAVRETFDEIFRNTKSIRFALGDVRVRVIGDIAYVNCIENLVSEESDTGDYLGAVLATNIFERRHGEWRLIHHHASPFASDEADLPEGPLH